MRVVIGNQRMMKRTGTEIVTRDFAVGLRQRGHEVAVYAPVLGPMAAEVRQQDVAVVDTPSALPFAPDIFHFNHYAQIVPALAAFPDVPAIYHCHVPGEAIGASIRHPGVKAHYGVSRLAVRRIEDVIGRPATGLLGNFVDPALCPPRGPLPARPRRWLVICQKKHGLRHLATIALAAALHGARLTAVGPRVKRRIDNVPAEAARHDLVFASARCAIEAAAAGAAVVVTDYRGCGGLLTPDNVDELMAGNFGAESFIGPASLKALRAAINAYDADACDQAARIVRQRTDLNKGVDLLEAAYASARVP